MAALMLLNPDFREFAESLNAEGVEYLVVGGYALAAHGHPRYAGSDFKANKRASGRAKDLADLESLDPPVGS